MDKVRVRLDSDRIANIEISVLYEALLEIDKQMLKPASNQTYYDGYHHGMSHAKAILKQMIDATGFDVDVVQ
jgi:hypothetical protein